MSTKSGSSSFTTGRLLLLAGLLTAAGCATDTDGEESSGEDAFTEGDGAGVVYFHGMDSLGFGKTALQGKVSGPLFAPGMTNAGLQAPTAPTVTSFLAGHPGSVVGGYSLGRVPVFRLMMGNAQGMKRVVMIDPTFDSAGSITGEKKIGGGIAKKWLDADEERTFILVYGDVTKELEGEQSYTAALSDHPRAELCFIPGAHDRFRAADMAFALVAKDCADLKAHLGK